jgi:aryl-alcohol dehydrogenase-like predicted oxidoreductase
VVSIQNRYNLSDRGSESRVDHCAAEGLAFLPGAPIQDRGRNRTVARIAERHGVGPHQVALAWLLARSPAMLPIPGTSSVRHLEDNVAAAGLRLSEEEVETLGDIVDSATT